jgi:homoserine O-succinyltransferase
MADGSTAAEGRRGPKPRLRIGLVNNMPDAALQATERQFRGLLTEAARGRFDIDLRLYALTGVPRGDAARALLDARYESPAALRRCGADALIVTGSEPRAEDLRQEAYWDELAGLVTWADRHTTSSLWSCLAAHAAVLHLDGIERQRLPAKLSGVYAFERAADGGLLRGLSGRVVRPHSRYNGLLADDLAASGYRLLTRADDAGVDTFMRRDRSLFLFFQGHPEYDPDSLMREYRRDVGRFLRGERGEIPNIPANYFDAATAQSLRVFETHARQSREAGAAAWSDAFMAGFADRAPWRASAAKMVRNWLSLVAEPQAAEVVP